jgi:TrmH family RNA methyltransferase
MLEIEPREFARLALDAAAVGPVAVLYGTERTGLTNEELELCQYLVTIPANPHYSSLNLASAVQVLSYELRCEALGRVAVTPPIDSHVPAPNEQLERYFVHLEQVLDLIGFFGDRSSTKIMRRVRRLYQRGMPDERELQILRGILTETEIAVRGRRVKQ